MAAAAAITGHLTDVRNWNFDNAPATLESTNLLVEGGSA
jgi:hypothetical protein